MTAEQAKSSAAPPDGYRPGVGILLFDARGRVFVAQRNDVEEEAWQMPQGGVDPGEAPREAALRELAEEIGTSRVQIVGETAGWLSYDLPPTLRRRSWGGRFRGQAQKWFAARFTGTDADIDLDAHHHREFSQWRWVELDALTGLIVDFKRPLYRAVVDELGPVVRAAAGA